MWWADTCQIIEECPPDVHNINAHTMFGQNRLIIKQVIIQTYMYGRQITLSKIDVI